MQLEFTREQDQLRDSVRDVLTKEWPAAAARRVVEDDDRESVDRLWQTFVSLDWPALAIPEVDGGVGLGFVEVAVLAEELGRAIAPGPLLPTIAQFVPVVREAGTPDQTERFLRPVAAGECGGTVAVAGADGVASFVASARQAGEIAVVTDDRVFVVRRDDVAVSVVPTIDATREMCSVDVNGVVVPDDRVLGRPQNVGRALQEATVATALEIVGASQTIFDTALEYAKVRHQFGVPIGSFQAVKHKLANMFLSLERARSTCYYAALTIAEDDDRREMATSMAKAAAGDCQKLVAQDGIQLLGGIGYTWEHDIHLYVKRAKACEGLFGTAAEHRAKVADLLGI